MSERRDELVDAALELLASLPPAQVSTRAIATAVGISQPAIRHFASRDALLAAVADRVRGRLRAAAEDAPPACEGALAHLHALNRALAEVIATHPGLPRLLFHELAEGVQRPSLGGVLAMQRGLISEVLGLAVAQGEVPATVDADAAAQLYVALLQGTLASWLSPGGGSDLGAQMERAWHFWVAGLPSLCRTGEASTPTAMGDQALVVLDVRDLLAQGIEPLPTIQEALATVRPDGRLVLLAPFEPRPLQRLLAAKGWEASPTAFGEEWEIEFAGPEAGPVRDLRDLPAPEPLEQTLLAVSKLAPDEVWWGRMPRVPRLLLPHLQQRSLAWAIHPDPEGSALLAVWRSP